VESILILSNRYVYGLQHEDCWTRHVEIAALSTYYHTSWVGSPFARLAADGR